VARTSYVEEDKIHRLDDTINTRFSIHEHLKHGDGVKVAALWVEDAKSLTKKL
jgi:4-hydroxyphenylpyruvate dioxygenase